MGDRYMDRRKGKHLSFVDRLTIERMILKGYKKNEIADVVGCCIGTIYNELKRSRYKHTTTELLELDRYNPDGAEAKYRKHLKAKGQKPKILSDEKLMKYIEYMIVEYKYSPKAVLDKIKEDNLEFDINIKSVNTIYSAIKKGYLKGVTLEALPRHGKFRKRKKRVVTHKKLPAGTSIEKRPSYIDDRLIFGHWEMDSVIGQISNHKTALVVTERKTRFEIIEPMKAHTTEEVVRALNRIEKRYGSAYFRIFKTITVDNGSEFKDYEGMEKALYRVGKRSDIYYCHPNSPHERGTNENNNILIRRHLPKGSNFDILLTRTKVKEVEAWINEYPRGILNGKSAKYMFNQELRKLNLAPT